jgi:two-component system phosphate regulon sensor histidine kinase PhoR
VERLKVQVERAGLEVQIDCPEDLPPALADARRLEQVIVNLLHNAIKFTPAGGRVRLIARATGGANGVAYGEQIQFAIQDTGVGIPPGDLARIFERFYKTDRARATGGTGLGLAIARRLIEAHDGRIWVESVERQGSTFYFTIPVADE